MEEQSRRRYSGVHSPRFDAVSISGADTEHAANRYDAMSSPIAQGQHHAHPGQEGPYVGAIGSAAWCNFAQTCCVRARRAWQEDVRTTSSVKLRKVVLLLHWKCQVWIVTQGQCYVHVFAARPQEDDAAHKSFENVLSFTELVVLALPISRRC